MKIQANMAALAAIAVAMTFAGCAARYRTIHKGLGGDEAGKKPTDSDAIPDDSGKPAPQGPSAAIEALIDGKVVTHVRVGETFTVRPTEGTMDPDDKAKADTCRNPGIVKASYEVNGSAAIVVGRADVNDCSTLEAKTSIAEAGKHPVTLVVTSDEDETAKAELTLIVLEADAPESPATDGFIVDATPTIVDLNEPVTFTGTNCDGTIAWNFKDGSDGAGTPVQHPYATAGSYEVVAICTLKDDGGTREGKVTVVVTPDPSTDSSSTATGTSTSTSTATNTNTNTGTATGTSTSTSTSTNTSTSTSTGTGTGPDQHPGQHPGQTPNQSPFQGKNP